MALMGLLLLLIAASVVLINGEAKEGCQESCGDVSIPYPFGTNVLGNKHNTEYFSFVDLTC